MTRSILIFILVGACTAIIVDIEAGQQFCMSDLESDHSGQKFYVKLFGVFMQDSEKLVVSVHAL